MTLLYSRLPVNIERSAVGGPTNRGRVKVYTQSGKLSQQFGWSAPLHEWDVSFGVRTAADFETLSALWHVVNFVPYTGFLFRAWSDYIATQANSRLTFITGSTWQMQRVYTIGAASFVRDITKPCAAPAPVVYRTRSAVVSVATATVDTTTGIATISGHSSGDTYTWAGHFDIPVTFAGSDFPGQVQVARDGVLVALPSIRIEELRL